MSIEREKYRNPLKTSFLDNAKQVIASGKVYATAKLELLNGNADFYTKLAKQLASDDVTEKQIAMTKVVHLDEELRKICLLSKKADAYINEMISAFSKITKIRKKDKTAFKKQEEELEESLKFAKEEVAFLKTHFESTIEDLNNLYRKKADS